MWPYATSVCGLKLLVYEALSECVSTSVCGLTLLVYCGLKLLVYEALCECVSTSVCGLTLLVHVALSYSCMRPLVSASRLVYVALRY
jgi:hypothetical protein